MKRLLLVLALAAALPSCRSLVLEDRLECPSFLFFEITNAHLFAPYSTLYTTVDSHPEGSRIATGTPTVKAVQEGAYWVEVRRTAAVKGYGILGDSGRCIQRGDQWLIPLGQDADTLYRFAFAAAVEPERFTVPVELIKEHAKVTVQFVGVETFTSAHGRFPFEIAVKGNTCGIDAVTGLPVRGPFECRPAEGTIGRFEFVLPRQADQDLTLEIYGREYLWDPAGHLETLNLYELLLELGGITWREKHLPDLYVEIDYQAMEVSVQVAYWAQYELTFDL